MMFNPITQPIFGKVSRPIFGGVNVYNPNSVRFDGTNDNLGALVGGSVTDQTHFCMATKIYWHTISGAQELWRSRTNRVQIQMTGEGLSMIFKDASENILAQYVEPFLFSALTPYMLIITVDSGFASVDPRLRIFFQEIGTSNITNINVPTDDTGNIDWTDAQYYFGATNTGGNRLNASVADLYVSQANLNANSTALQQKFITPAGQLVEVSDNGDSVTGTSPLVYLNNPFATFNVNKSSLGLQGDFTTTGTLTQGYQF